MSSNLTEVLFDFIWIFHLNANKTLSFGAKECRVWTGNFNVKVWKTTQYKLHKIWRSLKFTKIQENEHTNGLEHCLFMHIFGWKLTPVPVIPRTSPYWTSEDSRAGTGLKLGLELNRTGSTTTLLLP